MAIVGAPGRGSTDVGQAYAWRYDGADWQLEQEIIASDWQAYDNFASAIALVPGLVAIAAPGDSDQMPWRGSVYMYRYNGSNWVEEAIVVSSSLSAEDVFGADVALTADGSILAVGVLRDPAGPDVTGQVVVFHYDGASWVEEAVLAASDSTANNRFGNALALEGDYLIVGAPSANTAASTAGAVYIFKRLGVGNWEQQGVFIAEGAAVGDQFGAAVALDTGRALIGAPERAEVQSGGGRLPLPRRRRLQRQWPTRHLRHRNRPQQR